MHMGEKGRVGREEKRFPMMRCGFSQASGGEHTIFTSDRFYTDAFR